MAYAEKPSGNRRFLLMLLLAQKLKTGAKRSGVKGIGAERAPMAMKRGEASGTARSAVYSATMHVPRVETGGKNVWKRRGALARLFRFPGRQPKNYMKKRSTRADRETVYDGDGLFPQIKGLDAKKYEMLAICLRYAELFEGRRWTEKL